MGRCATSSVGAVVGAETASLGPVAGAGEAVGDSIDGAVAEIEAGGTGADGAVASAVEVLDGCAAPRDVVAEDAETRTCGLAVGATGALCGRAH